MLGAFRISPQYTLDMRYASDDQILDTIASLIEAYLRNLFFSQAPGGLDFNGDGTPIFNGSPYDVFLIKNGLPQFPTPASDWKPAECDPCGVLRECRAVPSIVQLQVWIWRRYTLPPLVPVIFSYWSQFHFNQAARPGTPSNIWHVFTAHKHRADHVFQMSLTSVRTRTPKAFAMRRNAINETCSSPRSTLPM
jgi:hypothetical protein